MGYQFVCVVVWLWLATTGPRGRSTTPPPAGVGRRMERTRQKLVGWDKGSLSEQQTKGTVTTTVQIRRTYKTNSEMDRATLTAWCPAGSQAVTAFSLASCPHWKPSMLAHGVELNTLLCLASLGQSAPAVSRPGFW